MTHPVIWIGGSPCAGKSTIAARLCERFERRYYSCDDAYFQHQELVTPEKQPVYSRLVKLDCDGLWMRPVPRQIEEELEIYREEFPFILSDLREISMREPVIAEGAALLPELLAAHSVPPHQAVWMVPTPEFQIAHYSRRPWRHDVVKPCSEPELAWQNWMARDAGFALAVAEQAKRNGYLLLTTDGTQRIEDVYAQIEEHLGLRVDDDNSLS